MVVTSMLIVRCSPEFQDSQIVFLHSFLEVMGIHLVYADAYSKQNFIDSFSECDFMFDYVYLTGHSNEDVFGTPQENFSWEFVAETIQNSGCIKDSCKLIIKSCKSIDENIANIFFSKTTKIQQVLGSTIDSENFSGYVGTMLFLYLTQWHNIDYKEATKITNTTSLNSFDCYLRR